MGSLLDAAMSDDEVNNADAQVPAAAHQQFQDSASKLSPDEFHAAATDALTSVSPDTRAKLGQALAGQGAAEGAGVPADTKKPGELAKMVHWVHNHVPGGVPGALGIVGAAGIAGGAAYEANENKGAVSSMVSKAKDAVGGTANVGDVLDGGTAHTVFNALQASVAGQVENKVR